MSELEPQRHAKKAVQARRMPSEVVPVPVEEVPDFIRDALKGTSLLDPFAQLASGWFLFDAKLSFEPVDATHTRIGFDAAGKVGAADVLLYTRRLGEIHRFFVALQDELDRREERAARRTRHLSAEVGPSIGSNHDERREARTDSDRHDR
ncbi:hypothetical protein [Leifsonia sp. P73]|uniref:hypothetical protein n=1 Tax=Leifsonia sp. P73 TaxID=3423959 RepID=UPI003DA5CAE9